MISCCSFFPSPFYLEIINNKFRPVCDREAKYVCLSKCPTRILFWSICVSLPSLSPFSASFFHLLFTPTPPAKPPPPLPLLTQAKPDIQDYIYIYLYIYIDISHVVHYVTIAKDLLRTCFVHKFVKLSLVSINKKLRS